MLSIAIGQGRGFEEEVAGEDTVLDNELLLGAAGGGGGGLVDLVSPRCLAAAVSMSVRTISEVTLLLLVRHAFMNASATAQSTFPKNRIRDCGVKHTTFSM